MVWAFGALRFPISRWFKAALRSAAFGSLGEIVTAASVAMFCTSVRMPSSLARAPYETTSD